ncbi:MAG: HlyC/CorC family transporter [Methylobacteriaceae bacterium]|nr:HlyC/CorC family transporter [Methylobacteriaceae bacterium]
MSEQHREARGEAGPSRPGLFERLRGLFGLGGASIRDDIQEALEESTASTDFSPQERTMLQNVLGLRELRVDDVMVPRADIVAVHIDASLADVLSLFRTAGHSRLPVHGDTLDDPRGMVHIRDFLDFLAASAEKGRARRRKASATGTRNGGEEPPKGRGFGALDLSRSLAGARIIRPVLFVPPSMPALDLLLKMQATHTHMALVIDEYGGTDGLVSIEDIVETIVGDIEDEHDEGDAPSIAAAPDGSFIVDARASLEDISKVLDVALEEATDAEEIDTIGGLISTLAGRVPVRGEIIAGPHDLEFEILDADPRRVKRLRIHRGPTLAPAPQRRRRTRAGEPKEASATEAVTESPSAAGKKMPAAAETAPAAAEAPAADMPPENG